MTVQEKNSWTDIVLGTIFTTFGAAVYGMTLGLPGPVYDPLGPAFMPRALALSIIVCSAVILYHGIRKRFPPPGKRKGGGENQPAAAEATPLFTRHPLTAGVSMGLVFLYILALDLGLSGFRTLTIVFVLVLGGIFINAEKAGGAVRKGIVLFLLALFLSFGMFYLFTQVFIVDLY